jgi:exonuclease VII large subunit
LERGYALVLDSDGAVIRSVSQVVQGEHVRTRLHDGDFISTVDEAPGKNKRKK